MKIMQHFSLSTYKNTSSTCSTHSNLYKKQNYIKIIKPQERLYDVFCPAARKIKRS